MNKDQLKMKLTEQMARKRASLSPAESFFLHQLLIDEPLEDKTSEPKEVENLQNAVDVLTDDMLFSVPPTLEPSTSKPLPVPPKARRRSTVGLWKAHQSGVDPKKLAGRGSLALRAGPSNLEELRKLDEESGAVDDKKTCDSEDDAASDQEVRGESKDDVSEASSWNEEDHQDHYDTWEVLKDEYAEDFGFGFSSRSSSIDDILNGAETENFFQILGTDANDMSAQPHVLSPPLMDAIMNFLPKSLVSQNYWLKFSLVRDGASLDTLKQYVRASQFTVVAIETPKGEVFGSFTSNPWSNHYGFFGSGADGAAFVWKMRHSRQTKCHSLFDQAQLESEIDVFMCQDESRYVQVCRHDALAVGGDDALPSLDESDDFHETIGSAETKGFAFALEDDLMRGSTSPSATFKSPSLCGSGNRTEIFDIAGLEVWSFTPCFSVDAAERLEMSKFFISQSSRSQSSNSPYSSESSLRSPGGFSSRDLDQTKFYQRVGFDTESQERRTRWQRSNMM